MNISVDNKQKLIFDSQKLVLLYVESDEAVATKLILILKKLFNKIIWVKDGDEGFSKFNEMHIDVIITEINLPNLSGFDMLRKIKSLNNNIPSVILTNNSTTEYYQDIIDLNIKGFVLKTLADEKLVDVLVKIIIDIKDDNIKNDKFNYLVSANKKLIDIGYQISYQKDFKKLLEAILLGAKDISNADGGTLYLFNEANKTLEFQIVINSSLGIQHGGTKNKISWPALNIYNEDKTLNKENVAVVSAMDDKLINITDIYHSTTFNFNGAKKFDLQNDYKTSSMLVIPMKNRENDLIGVIQLINKLENGNIIAFDGDDESLITSVSAQATMVIENNQLVNDLEILLHSLVKSIGSALNEKSNYTAKHVDNVARLSNMLANGIHKNQTLFKDIFFTDNEFEEIKLAAWLHDVGKITTPEYIIDKPTKLNTIFDKIDLIKAKFEILKRDIEIQFLNAKITLEDKNNQIKEIEEDIEFIRIINNGDTRMTNEHLERLNNIASKTNIIINNAQESLINEDELYNLSILKGTLTNEERNIIHNHVHVTYNMLKEVPFPKKFANVAKMAGSHHKTVNGKGGYCSKELVGIEMSIQDKILAVADIFEALSAHDRPYRGPNTLSQIANILVAMVKKEELDKDIVKLFFEEKLYLEYAREYLSPAQIDDVSIDI